MIADLTEVRAHSVAGETLAALGAWMAVENRVPLVGPALTLIATVYPHRVRDNREVTLTHRKEKPYGNQKASRGRSHYPSSRRER